MKISALRLGLVAALCCAVSAALAQNPFVGTWKVDYSRSHVTGDTLTFAPEANDRVRITHHGRSFSFKLDGSAATTPEGEVEHWTKVDDKTWKTERVVGDESFTDTWTLSADGKTLEDLTTGTKPNGDPIHELETLTRTAPGKGFYGSWRSTKVSNDHPNSFQIDANGDNGIVWRITEMKDSVNLTFDGKEAAPTGPGVLKGLTLSATRTSPRSFRFVEKVNGKLVWTGSYTVSPDGKTLTRYGHSAGSATSTKVVYQKF